MQKHARCGILFFDWGEPFMNEMQLKVFANMIAAAMKAGEMDKVSEIYSKVSTMASMEEAAVLEQMIAAAMG